MNGANPSYRLSAVIALLLKYVVIAVLGAAIGFWVGRWKNMAIPVHEVNERTATLEKLSERNRELKAAVRQATLERRSLDADTARDISGEAFPVPRIDGLVGEPLLRYEIQESVLKNLRKILAARDQFQLEHGRAPSSIEEIVGIDGYFKRLVSVDGEDYTSLPMTQGSALSVTTLSGVTVNYGDGIETPVDYPADIARMKALANTLRPAAKVAYEAYRFANHGKDPDSADAVLPFFATQKERAAYLEFLEAHRKVHPR